MEHPGAFVTPGLESEVSFGLRLKDSSLPEDEKETGLFVDPVQDGSDLLVPLLLSGHGRVQTSRWVSNSIQSRLYGRFRMCPEIFLGFPKPCPYVNPWQMRAERGLAIVARGNLVHSFAGMCTLMCIHPDEHWRGVGKDIDVSGSASGIFIDIDLRSGDEIPGELHGVGFRLNDEKQEETPFTLPVAWEVVPESDQKSPPAARSSRRATNAQLLPGATAEQVRAALEWARTKNYAVGVKVTSVKWSGNHHKVTKLGRMSDISLVRSAPGKDELDELGQVLEKNRFKTIAGAALCLALHKRS